MAACNRRDAALALQQIDVIHAAVAPLAAGDKGMPAYDRCVNWLMRLFRKQTVAPTSQHSDFAVMAKSASRSSLTPAEASFAAAARVRLMAEARK